MHFIPKYPILFLHGAYQSKAIKKLANIGKEMTEQDQEFVEYIVKALVDHPEDVKTDRSVDEMGVLITLHLNPADMGQVIGRQGQTAKAIRTLLRVVGAKRKARVNLKINEPEGYQRPQPAAAPAAHSSFDSGSDAMDEFKL